MTAINKKIVTFIFALLISSITFADKSGFKCIPDSVLFNDILNCYIKDYKTYDNELNALYKLKMSKLSKQKREKLKKSQIDWIKKKESICVADEKEYGRESHFEAISCQIEMTKNRIVILRKY